MMKKNNKRNVPLWFWTVLVIGIPLLIYRFGYELYRFELYLYVVLFWFLVKQYKKF